MKIKLTKIETALAIVLIAASSILSTGCFDTAGQLDGGQYGCDHETETEYIEIQTEPPGIEDDLEECDKEADSLSIRIAELEAEKLQWETERGELLDRMAMKNFLINDKAWRSSETWIIEIEGHCDLEVVEL